MTQGSLNAYLKKEVWYGGLDRLTLDLGTLTNPSNSIVVGGIRIWVYNGEVWWTSSVNPDALAGFRCAYISLNNRMTIIGSVRVDIEDPTWNWYCRSMDAVGWQTVFNITAGRMDIPRAGDITFLDDKFLKIGKDSDGTLPTPDASYRGKMIRVEDATGDKVYICEWNGSAFAWRQI